ncbi:toll/interleukin-1 receptor domain-containing protein [Phosphitispora fastidiosa]|uniref:toll/interleukin-1 receptor domain-containing protein n=1 Tax=Phosphitispora fastidiosa TaxID=2837202 RepID=UPI001E2D4EAD|nr:toll/interleukin-1 receptor domain-containing protein [Phosphitispora fastidiosa]MBU7006861.1 tetratricopeptide (TPR) repeat protein [Phosphitispora fastidiosa]
MNVFLSYGHDAYVELAKRIKTDLEAQGYKVWFDEDRINTTHDWEISIEKGVITSDWIVVLMTPHSMRRPDGVCLDELSYARFLGKQIAPIMVRIVPPPLSIARIQWLDMQNCVSDETGKINEELYQDKLRTLLKTLNGEFALGFEGEQARLRDILRPLDNEADIDRHIKDFYGRQWMFDAFKKWVTGDFSSRIFWVKGKAGVGKTAFVAALCHREPVVVAVHFCKFNDNERADSKKAISSICYQLAMQLPEYQAALIDLPELNMLREKNTKNLFNYLLVEPLRSITNPGKRMVIVIDALDEASWGGKNELVDVLTQEFDSIPEWLGIVVSSRPEPEMLRKLSKFKPYELDNMDLRNMDDIRGYFSAKLSNYSSEGHKEAVVQKLVTKSEGIFLYAQEVIKEIEIKRLSLDNVDDFPTGLTGIYLNYFERQFQDYKFYQELIRPLFELISVNFEPLAVNVAETILGWDEYDRDDILEKISTIFPLRQLCIEPIHKSVVDWMTDSGKSGRYRISAKKGHQRFSDGLWKLYKKDLNQLPAYGVKYMVSHLLFIEKWDESIEALNDYSLQEKRIKIVSLDSAMRAYFMELNQVFMLRPELVTIVLTGETFQCLMALHRRYLYDSGLFLDLQKMGFDKILAEKKEFWLPKAEVACAFYLYLTENFIETIERAKKIQNFGIVDNTNTLLQSELYNLIGLNYRKLACFQEARDSFEKSIQLAESSGDLYEASAGYMNIAKLNYHMLDFEDAYMNNNKGIALLTELLESKLKSNAGECTSLKLFLAEYHRLAAETYQWNEKIKEALIHLEIAGNIYKETKVRDRYYVRWLYTSAFQQILSGDYHSIRNDFHYITGLIKNEYDRSRAFFTASFAKLLEFGHTGNGRVLSDAGLYAKEAIKRAKSINAVIEEQEAQVLYNIIAKKSGEKANYELPHGSKQYIKDWVIYVNNYISKFLRRVLKHEDNIFG